MSFVLMQRVAPKSLARFFQGIQYSSQVSVGSSRGIFKELLLQYLCCLSLFADLVDKCKILARVPLAARVPATLPQKLYCRRVRLTI